MPFLDGLKSLGTNCKVSFFYQTVRLGSEEGKSPEEGMIHTLFRPLVQISCAPATWGCLWR